MVALERFESVFVLNCMIFISFFLYVLVFLQFTIGAS